MMALPTRTVLLLFALMTLLHSGVCSFRQTPSNRQLDEEDLGKLDYIRLRKGSRDGYAIDRGVLQGVAETEDIQAMMVKRSSSTNSRPIMTSYLTRRLSKRSDDLGGSELTGAGHWPEDRMRRMETRDVLDGQIEWLFSRVYPWRVAINDDNYFGNHVDLIGSSIIG